MPAKPIFSSSIEPLEARIAPALLVNGANLLGGASPSSGETSVGNYSVTLVKVLAGQALVWFDGFNITSISVGPGAKLDITGDVRGDIIGNLTADGSLSDSDGDPTNGEDGGVLLANDILGIKTRPLSSQKGDVPHIITGGSISNVDISGVSEGIYAGDGVFRAESRLLMAGTVGSSVGSLDINPVVPGVQGSFNLTSNMVQLSQLKAGASISNIKLTGASQLQMFAGNGSPDGTVAAGNGPAGGSITTVKIETASVPINAPVDTPSYHLITGDGAAGKRGGAGGSINTVIEAASSGPVIFFTGQGGLGTAGAGGAGGSILNLDLQSASSRYTATAGDGGAGTPGGAGGKLFNNNFSNRTPTTGVLISADFTGDGLDDVLVADPGTGQMVLSKNIGNGNNFVQVGQEPGSVLIDTAGISPVDGLASDMDGDGDLDAIILYKDGTLAIFLNKGESAPGANDGGVFYDPNANNGAGGFEILSFDLGYRPSKIAQVTPGGFSFVIAENTEGKGTLHLLSMAAFGGELSTSVLSSVKKFSIPIVDIVGHYAGLSNGQITRFDFTFDEQNAFATVETLPNVLTGGLVDLDLDADGTHLLALSGSRSMAVYDVGGVTPAPSVVIPLNQLPGTPLLAKFVRDSDPNTVDSIVVLSAVGDGAQFTSFEPIDDGNASTLDPFVQAASLVSSTPLKNFAPVYGSTEPDLAALAGALSSFTLVQSLASDGAFPLPFANKKVTLTGGDGGFGMDIGRKLGKGGAGGSVTGTNADAQEIKIIAGIGGNSTNGAAGAGGSISNSITPSLALAGLAAGSFKTAGGTIVTPRLIAETKIELTAGIGGMPTGADVKSAAGGAGGDLFGLNVTLTAGDTLTLAAGAGGIGNGGAGGAGGGVKNVHSLAQSGSLVAIGGLGGAAMGNTGNGGAGGAIVNFTHELALDADQEKVEQPYSVTITAGAGGTSMKAIGGAGGDLSGISLKLDGADRTYADGSANPPLIDAHLDTTVTITGAAGAGGSGFTGGGPGGNFRGFTSDSVFDQQVSSGVYINYVVLGLFAGPGGNATSGNGGNGGSVVLARPISGISSFDPDMPGYDPATPALFVAGGVGGEGSVRGGNGGGVSGLVAQNSPAASGDNLTRNQLFGALVLGGVAGNGGTGDGGIGGTVSSALLGVFGGNLDILGGSGGASVAAKGGAGGGVTTSEFGLVDSGFALGMSVAGGGGGAGKTAGGAGGNLLNLRINTPQSTFSLSAALVAGSGGDANAAAGLAGKGGDVNGVTQAKDFNSSINLIQAGNGGDNLLGKAGAGGNVLNVKTVGFVGRRSDSVGTRLGVFDSSLVDDDNDPMTPPISIFPTIAQGIFSGRGGDGVTDGINGSISNIAARQIAAMAAAADPMSGIFAVASKISNVKAALIGFDADGDGVFDTTAADGATPGATKPVDGFILAAALSKVTGSRAAFTFAA